MNKQINIIEAIDWYIWTGVEETCGDLPCLVSENNEIKKQIFEPSVASQTNKFISEEKPASSQAFSPVTRNAREICKKAEDLSQLREIMQNFEGCNLKHTAASTVFGDGNPKAKIVLIGEAPGADEDRIGKPFVGRCGKLLDKMFDAIGLKREECYITNVLPWRPPGNRAPTDEEIAVCLPFLKRQLELIEPDYLLLLGGIALKSVMDVTDSISRSRGKWLEYSLENGKTVQVLATYHPSYLLRSCAQKSKVWIDLLRLKKQIKENS